MRSIDRLREYVKDAPASSMGEMARAIVAGMTDEIEREVGDNERFRAEAEPFTDRLREAVGERADVTLFGVDYTPLPVDADGEPWRIGDVIAWPDGSGLKSVIGIGKDCLFYVDSECEYKADLTVANDKHHAPTVEDVLREFTRDWCNAACAGDMTNAERDAARADTIAEYAARLRLASNEE